MSIDIVFDGPPSHESGRFVEVEDEHRRGIRIGEWIERDDGLWALRIPDPREFTRLESENAELRAEVERYREALREIIGAIDAIGIYEVFQEIGPNGEKALLGYETGLMQGEWSALQIAIAEAGFTEMLPPQRAGE